MSDQDDTTEEAMLLAKGAQLQELIREYFPTNTDHGERRVLVCKLCDKPVTWVTRHLAERHHMDVEVWRLPKWSDETELW